MTAVLAPAADLRPEAPEPGARRRRSWLSALLLLTPLLVLFVLGFAIPLVTVARFSFDQFTAGNQVSAWTLGEYGQVLGSGTNRALILRTLELALITTVISAVIGYPLALAITRGPRRLRPVLMAILLMPLMISVVVKTFGWTVLLGTGAFPQRLLTALHIPVKLLFSPTGVTIGLVHTYMPFMALSLVAALSTVDRSTEEAAASLGSGPWRVFRTVTLPLTLDGLVAGAVLTFAASMSALVTPEILGGGKVDTVVTAIYDQATSGQNFPLAAALGIILLLVTLIVMVLQAKVVRRVRHR